MIRGERPTNKICFPRIAVTEDERNNELRTDSLFRNRYQPEHHKKDSILELLPIDMVKAFPISDALHLFDLGITRRYIMTNSKSHWRLSIQFEIFFILKITANVAWRNKRPFSDVL